MENYIKSEFAKQIQENSILMQKPKNPQIKDSQYAKNLSLFNEVIRKQKIGKNVTHDLKIKSKVSHPPGSGIKSSGA
ncbi:MAG: hypothetical protein QM752_02155 [Gammaproteobacteria bacterium]